MKTLGHQAAAAFQRVVLLLQLVALHRERVAGFANVPLAPLELTTLGVEGSQERVGLAAMLAEVRVGRPAIRQARRSWRYSSRTSPIGRSSPRKSLMICRCIPSTDSSARLKSVGNWPIRSTRLA